MNTFKYVCVSVDVCVCVCVWVDVRTYAECVSVRMNE